MGLTEEEVVERRKKFGSNEICSKKKNRFFPMLLESLGDPIIKILLIALGMKTFFLFQNFDWFETIGIVLAILLASFISTVSEYGSEKAFERLQEESSKIKCRVYRDGKVKEIFLEEVVVDDLVLLESGDKIPADGILKSGELSVDESMLNGEVKEQKKKVGDFLFRGTVVYASSGKMKVTKVGSSTFYGKISEELQEKQPESPLKVRLRGLAEVISKIGYVGAFLVTVSYLFSVVAIQNQFDLSLMKETICNFPLMAGHLLYAMTLSVTIIVVAVPEGLPMMITLVLSSNMKRMLKSHVLVRKLVGIETSGSINLLFTDKTGTLTKGKMEVVGVLDLKGNLYKKPSDIPKEIKECMILNNASTYAEDGKVIGGNFTDQAILSFFPQEKILETVFHRIPFDSKKKYSSATLKSGKTYWKGAFEVFRPYSFSLRKWERTYDSYTKQGFRVLVMMQSEKEELKNLSFLGFLLLKDEIRKEAKYGVQMVKDAHIQTVMITGDNKETAEKIASEVGILNEKQTLVLTSSELEKMTDLEIQEKLPSLAVLARALPQDKSRLVRISQELDYIVGMTGDGVNDAPALKKADVGFSMGSGSEVAKEASDIVILDNNFLSISKAILFGRTIFKSIRKFIILQLTINFCAIGLSVIGPFIGIGAPVTVIQMLWINMVMDTLAGLSFAFEPPLLEYMKEYPKKKEEPIMNAYMIHQIGITGLYSCILCLLFLKVPFFQRLYRPSTNQEYLMTAFFALFIFIDIFNSLNARTHRLNLFHGILKNPVFLGIMGFIIIVQVILIYYGGSLFRTSGLTFKEFLTTVLIASSVIPFDFLRKISLRLKNNKSGV